MSDTPTTSAAPATPSTTPAPAVGGINTGTPAPAPEAPKTLKIKNVEFKSEDDAYAEIERGRQSNKLLTEAHKRLAEASRRDKEWDGLKSEVKTKRDARKVIEALGLSKEEAVETFGRWIYEEEVRAKEMSPEQRRIRELEQKIQAEEDRKAADKRKADQEQAEIATRQEEAKLKDEFTRALQQKKLPATRLAIRRVANYMAQYARQGVNVPVERAVDLVMEDYRNEYGEMFDELEPDQLIEKLGKQRFMALAKKISAWALKSSSKPQNVPPVEHQFKPKKQTEEKKMSPQEFQAFMRSVK